MADDHPVDEPVGEGSGVPALSRRRRELGIWRERPTWIENSGPGGAWQFMTYRDGVFVGVPGPASSTSFYGYGAPSWCSVSEDLRCLVVGSPSSLSVVSAEGAELARWECGGVAGYPVAMNDDAIGVIVHDPEQRRRRVVLWDWRAQVVTTVIETDELVGDLTGNAVLDQLAWLSWTSETMPWESARLHVAYNLEEQWRVRDVILPGPAAQPRWHEDALVVSCEAGEWYLPGSLRDDGWRAWEVPEGEFRPEEYFGWSWWAFTDDLVVASYVRESVSYVGAWDGSTWRDLPGGPNYVAEMVGCGAEIFVLGADEHGTAELWKWSTVTGAWETLDHSAPRALSRTWGIRRTSRGTPFRWRTPNAHPPHHPGRSLPGLMIRLHGGPARCASLAYDALDEALTGADVAVASVDYRGSTSYGRTHRRALFGRWGEADVEDALDVATYLMEMGEVDPSRVYIRGSSAGALTALLASASDVFRGVVVVSPVSDPRGQLEHEDEFESGFTRILLGKGGGNDSRSPRSKVGDLARRGLVIHGARDPIVPVAHTRDFVAAWRESGADVTYLEFPDEGHSLRSSDTQRQALEAELAFLRGPM